MNRKNAMVTFAPANVMIAQNATKVRMEKNDLPLPVTNHHLHCRCDYRKVEYQDMMVDDAVALDAIRCIMKNDIAIINDGVRRRPILNTSRKDCYDALYKIRSIIKDNENYHFAKVLEELRDKEKMIEKPEVDKDIQHVGYSQEACGYEK